MRRAEGVVDALRALGEARQSSALAQRPHACAPAGQYLVRIGLVADVPDEPVVRRVENAVQRDGQFDDAEARAEMPSGDRNDVNGLLAELGRHLLQRVPRERAQLGRIGNRVQQWSLG